MKGLKAPKVVGNKEKTLQLFAGLRNKKVSEQAKKRAYMHLVTTQNVSKPVACKLLGISLPLK
jgi:hypothetical protein